MRRMIAGILDRAPYIRRLRQRILELDGEIAALKKMQGEFPAGHYYSPIPSIAQVNEYLRTTWNKTGSPLEIDIDLDVHRNRLTELSAYYEEMPYKPECNSELRYHFNQSMFIYPDAIFLYCFLRQIKPRRIIEVGSGYSSAIMLDTAEKKHYPSPEMTCIEPYPERLNSLLKASDRQRFTLMPEKVQNVPLSLFEQLGSGDLLFIDSSHVISAGSDCHFIFSEVLPRIKPGVFVHFHDVVYPFIYPKEWLQSGRYWNEAYFLRAFLAYNRSWEIYWFNSFASREFTPFLSDKMPLSLRGTGGSIYLRRLPAHALEAHEQ